MALGEAWTSKNVVFQQENNGFSKFRCFGKRLQNLCKMPPQKSSKSSEKSVLGRPRADIFGFRGRFFKGRKIIDFSTSQKRPPDPKISALGRPRVDFSWIFLILEVPFCIDFATIFRNIEISKNQCFPNENQRFSRSKGSQHPSNFH